MSFASLWFLVGGDLAALYEVHFVPRHYTRTLQNVTFDGMQTWKSPRFLLLILSLFFVADAAATEELKVLAPREFKNILGELGEFFRGRSPGWKAKEQFASQKDIESQILSAWTSDVLIMSEAPSLKPFLKNAASSGEFVSAFLHDPVVIVAKDNFKETIQSPKGLLYEGLQKVALCGKKHPLGSEALKFLESHRLWESVKDRVTETKSVGAALKLVSAGSADWTFTRKSAIARKSELKIIWSVPEEEIAADRYIIVARMSGERTDAVRTYLECLRSTIASKLFENAGYTVVAADAAPEHPSQAVKE